MRISLMRSVPWLNCLPGLVVCALLAGTLGGCSSSEYKTAPARGKVTRDGQPVKGGSVMFRPTSTDSAKGGAVGKSAAATVTDDGSFVLTTYASGDGAVVGKHQVSYSPPEMPFDSEKAKPGDAPPPSPYAGLVPKAKEVEIKAGQNDITIELVKP